MGDSRAMSVIKQLFKAQMIQIPR